MGFGFVVHVSKIPVHSYGTGHGNLTFLHVTYLLPVAEPPSTCDAD